MSSPATFTHFCEEEDVSWFVKSMLGTELVRGEGGVRGRAPEITVMSRRESVSN